MQDNKQEFQKNTAESDKWDFIIANTLVVLLIVGSLIAVMAVGGMSN